MDTIVEEKPQSQFPLKPRFSVIIPAYNRARLISTTVESILSSEFPNFEVIVVVDGSKDGTKEVLQSFGTRIKLIIQEGQGAEAARARGASEANGEYLAFLDDDDLLLPWSLQVYDKIICELDSPPLVLGHMSYFEDGNVPFIQTGEEHSIEILKYRDYLSKEAPLSLSCSLVVVQKSVYDASAERRNRLKAYPFDDLHLLLSMGTLTPCVLVTKPITVAKRIHASNFSSNVQIFVEGIVELIRFESKGNYPGGPSRRFGRYAILGGMSWFWAGRGLKQGHYALALGLLVKSCPHLVAGALNKMIRRGKSTAVPIHFVR